MPLSRSACHALLIGALLAPSVASAGVVVLTPLVPARGVNAGQVADVFALMSSELEFMADVDEVVELDPAPAALTLACLDSTRCLGGVTKDAHGDLLITGAVDDSDDDLVVDLLLYERAGNRVIRRKTFTIPGTASDMVDRLPAVIKEIVTGVSSEQRKQDAMESLDFDAGSDDDVGFEDDRSARIEAPPPPRSTSGTSTTRAVDRTITAPPPPPPPPKEETFDPDAFSFGDSAEDISFGTSPSDITTGSAQPKTAPPPQEPARRPPPPPEDDYDPRYDPDLVDMDEDLDLDRSTSRERVSSTSSSTQRRTDTKKASASDDYRRVYIQARGGYANYGLFHFGSGGGELQVRVAGGLSLLAGVDAWFVTRELPPDLQASSGRRTITQTIVPIHAGFVYRIKPGKFQPYVGVDGIVAQYYTQCFNPSTQEYADCPATAGERASQGLVVRRSVAGGARARVGFDYLFTRNFGINIDAALGFWMGNDWPLVDQRLPTLAFLPYFGGGITVAF